MEVIKHSDSAFIIKDDAKVVSLLIFGALLLIAIAFFATVPDVAGMGLLALVLAGIYFITGYLSKTYIFDKQDKKLSVIETTFFKTSKKQYALDDIQNIVFVGITPYGPIIGEFTIAAELTHPSGSIVVLKTGQKIRIVPSASNFMSYLFKGDIVGLNESEAEVGKDLADFLQVPFAVKKDFDMYPVPKGPSKQFIKFLLKIVYALLIFLTIFVVSVLLTGIVNRLLNFF